MSLELSTFDEGPEETPPLAREFWKGLYRLKNWIPFDGNSAQPLLQLTIPQDQATLTLCKHPPLQNLGGVRAYRGLNAVTCFS